MNGAATAEGRGTHYCATCHHRLSYHSRARGGCTAFVALARSAGQARRTPQRIIACPCTRTFDDEDGAP